MPKARLTLELSELPAAEALRRAYALLPALSVERPVVLYGARLGAAAVVLGAYQHAPHALRADAFDATALPVVRRRTGGAAVAGGTGILYFALGLLHASVLMACPPGKILNRNVRGFLAGLRELGVPAHYFGRDFVSVAMQPGAYVGWAERSDGRVLLEFFLGLQTTFVPAAELAGYPERKEPALRGKPATTLAAALPRTRTGHEVLGALATGYAKAFGLELETATLSRDELTQAGALAATLSAEDLRDDAGLVWSAPHEDAIGFVSAGVKLDADGRFAALRLGGDFFERDGCMPQLEGLLLAREPTAQSIGAALDQVYGSQPGAIEGVRSLVTLQRAILDALERSRALGTER